MSKQLPSYHLTHENDLLCFMNLRKEALFQRRMVQFIIIGGKKASTLQILYLYSSEDKICGENIRGKKLYSS